MTDVSAVIVIHRLFLRGKGKGHILTYERRSRDVLGKGKQKDGKQEW